MFCLWSQVYMFPPAQLLWLIKRIIIGFSITFEQVDKCYSGSVLREKKGHLAPGIQEDLLVEDMLSYL